jgi:nifR3 family TIM-barrel protein
VSLLRPLRIGRVEVPNNLVLSPMAGYTDLPFRALCRRHGAGLVCTEMVASFSLEHEAKNTLQRATTASDERPVSIQIVGNDAASVGRAAALLDTQCDVLGLNLGCPAHQVASAGCGAALLDKPELALELVASIKASADAPLLVKMRAGTRSVMDCGAFARRLEQAGADGLIFHGRTASQSYRGKADWSLIRSVVEAVDIPVIGNGDIADGSSAARALEESGCAGIAIGRASLGDARVFARVKAYLERGEVLPESSPEERLADFRVYAQGAEREGLRMAHVLPHAQAFTRGIWGGAKLRGQLHRGKTPSDLVGLFEAHVEGLARSAASRDVAVAVAN